MTNALLLKMRRAFSFFLFVLILNCFLEYIYWWFSMLSVSVIEQLFSNGK